MTSLLKLTRLFVFLFFMASCAPEKKYTEINTPESFQAYDEIDPFSENIDDQLKALENDYFESTGQTGFLQTDEALYYFNTFQTCKKQTCPVWVVVDKSEQQMYVYVNSVLQNTWKVSTGAPGRETPLFDRPFNGRIYDAYTSSKYPGGDYNGLGNMPYALFIEGGFAIHGTGKANWSKLGKKASHGCVRLHPDNAFVLNRLVRQYTVKNTWVTVKL